jgi:hypothetical protein
MLVNMMGIEEGDEMADIRGRNSRIVVDPKTRDTLTTLFSAVLTSFVEVNVPDLSILVEPPMASVSHVPVNDQAHGDSEARKNAA